MHLSVDEAQIFIQFQYFCLHIERPWQTQVVVVEKSKIFAGAPDNPCISSPRLAHVSFHTKIDYVRATATGRLRSLIG